MTQSNWGGGASIMGLYRYRESRDRARMGSNTGMFENPRDGDLCVCIEHAGDCFYHYRVVNEKDGSLGASFGAYVFGEYEGKARLDCVTIKKGD